MKKEEENKYKNKLKESLPHTHTHTHLVSIVFFLVSIMHCLSANKSSGVEDRAGLLPSDYPSPGVVGGP